MPQWRLRNGGGTLRRDGRARGDQRPRRHAGRLDRQAADRRARRDGADAGGRCSARGCACCPSAWRWRPPALTFGALSLAGASLTLATIGVLPVLIGLAVDYAIQLQSRIAEEQEGGAGGGLPGAVDRAAARGAPAVATAAAATAAGFAVLVLSPVPMVRGFGLLLVAGIVLAFGCAITLGVGGARRARRRRRARAPPQRALAPRGAAPASCCAGRSPARARVRRRRWGPGPGRARRGERPPGAGPGRRRGGGGRGVGARDADARGVRRAEARPAGPRRAAGPAGAAASTGVGGELDLVVSGRRVTDPAVVRWMTSYQRDVLKRHGYSSRRGCGRADLCPAFSLPDLFAGGVPRTQRQVDALLASVPQYFSRGVISRDRRTATMAFGIRLMPLDRQQELIEALRARLDPPAGVRAELAGLPVLAAEANDRVSSPWRRFLGAGDEPRRRGGRPAGGLPPLAARARAAAPDRPGDRLVGARPVRPADPAQPDVGDPRRARRGDLHGVQRAAQPSATARSAPRGTRRRRRCSGPTARPAPPCWPPASRRSPGSPC